MGRCCGGSNGAKGSFSCSNGATVHPGAPALALLLLALPLQALGSNSSFERRDTQTGCRNWKAIGMRKHDKVSNPEECAEICGMIFGCVGFGYQVNNNCHPRGNTEIGACMLWSGECDNDGNGCWDDYLMTVPNTTTTVAAEQPLLGGDLQEVEVEDTTTTEQELAVVVVKSDGVEQEEEEESKCGYRWWVSIVLIIASCTQVILGIIGLRRYLNVFGAYVQQADGPDEERFFENALRAEVLLGLLFPWLAAGIGIPVAMALDIHHDALLFAQLFFLGLVAVRMSFVDITLWRTMTMSPAAADPVRKAPFLRSKLRAMDTVAGGLAVTSVLLMECSPLFHQRLELVLGFLDPKVSGALLAWVQFFGLADTLLVFLAAATLIRMEVALRMLEHEDGRAIAAEDAGFGATATVFKRKMLEVDEEEKVEQSRRDAVEAQFYNMILLVVEATPQFVLQGVAVLASGHGLLGSPMLAISLALGGLVLASRGVQLIWHLLCGICAMPSGRAVMALGAVPAVISLLLVGGTGVGLLLSEAYCFRSLLFDVLAGHCMIAPLPAAEPIALLQWLFALAGILPAGAVVLALSVVNLFWRANEQPSEEVEGLRGTARKVWRQ